MTVGLMGRKVGMTQSFDGEGLAVPVTVVQLGANIVTQLLTRQSHGYDAIQVGGFPVKEKKLNKPEAGVFKKRDLPLLKPLKEFRVDDPSHFNPGEPLKVESVLKEGELVDVQGQSIGKGFQGTVKRYHSGRGPMAHGSKFHRSMGSIGAGTTPSRVYKGVGMPGKMGNETVSVRHLKIVKVDGEKNLVLIKGALPGVEGSLLIIKPSRTKWNS